MILLALFSEMLVCVKMTCFTPSVGMHVPADRRSSPAVRMFTFPVII